MNTQTHWNNLYSNRDHDRLGWHETVPETSLRLIDRCHLRPEDPVIEAGAGASRLVDCLLHRGHTNVHAVDISGVALAALVGRLTAEEAARLTLHEEDLSRPGALPGLSGIALWHDRAMLHFLVDQDGRDAYRATLRRAVRPQGHVILAAFACHGATQCSGLPVERYTADKMGALLGADFHLLTSFDHLYQMPSGDTRPYIYACFQRTH